MVVVLLAIATTGLVLIRSNRRVFADVAALSDERRQLARQLITSRESTFRDIARELHDELGQVLTAIGSMLSRASRHLPDGSPVEADLRDIGEIAQGSLASVRSLSQLLHPSMLDELGLDSAIEWYLSTVDRQLGINVSWQRRGESRPVAPAVGIHVFRVLQEALTNVARHAATHAARVGLEYTVTSLELTVEDDGPGISLAHRPRGIGLIAMRERAAIVSGTITFETPPGGGTRVRMRLPLPDSQTE
jgi:signal transduction histidine kinase